MLWNKKDVQYIFCFFWTHRSCLHSEKKKCNNQWNERNNQSQFQSGETTINQPSEAGSVHWRVSDHVCCDFGVKMSYKVNYSPLLRAHTPPPQPCHKVCDVAHSSNMRGQTLLSKAVLCGSDPPDDSETSGMERLLRKCKIKNQVFRECMAECLGIYVLIVSISLRI